MRVLITGAGGFLGHGIIGALKNEFELSLLDTVPMNVPNATKYQGSVESSTDVAAAMQNADAVVIAHMLSRTTDRTVYDDSYMPFCVNVTGTAILFQEALKAGIKNLVLISSTGVVRAWEQTESFLTAELEPKSFGDLYTITKVCQEKIAEHYHLTHGMNVSILRPGGICAVDDVSKQVMDKYGNVSIHFHHGLIERRDIGTAVRCALRRNEGFNRYYVLGSQEARHIYEVDKTRTGLGWQPQYDFSWMPYNSSEKR